MPIPRLAPLLAVAATLLAAPAAASAATALSGEWRMNEGSGSVVADSAGANHGTIVATGGGAPGWIGGVEGSALRFQGGGHVRLPDAAIFESQRLSVEAWVRRTGSPGAFRYVVSKGGRTCETSSYGLYTGPSGGVGFYVLGADGFTRSPFQPPAQVWDGRWHQVVGAYDGARVRLFVDGREIGDGTPGPASIAYGLPSKSPLLGAYGGTCELPYDGDLDLVRLYTVALTSQSLLESFATPGARPATPPSPGTGGGSTGGSTGRSTSCVSVRTPKRTLRVGRKATVTVTVRRGRTAVARRRVLLSGGGLKARVRRSDSKGRIRFVVRPRRATKLKIRPVGQPSSCKSSTLRVRRR